MAFLVNKNTNFSRFQDTSSIEHHRPMMLKDFLKDDYLHNSCTSTSGLVPMYMTRKKSPVLVSSKSTLLRSRSKKAAATTISAIHKVINVVKFFQSVKYSPSVLPRSISRKLGKRSKDRNGILGDVSEVKLVKVKDILRWRSFRDMVEDNSTPLDFPPSPNRSTTATATTTSSCSKRSSWCDSDFTAEELPPWSGENEEFWGKKCFLGQPAGPNATLRNPKGNWSFEECEQQSPVSVLIDSPFREVEEPISPSHPTLANIENAEYMLTRRMQDFEVATKPKCTGKLSFGEEIANFEGARVAEEKAKQLLSHVEEDGKSEANLVVLDFFMHELLINGKFHSFGEFDCEILRIAKSWMNGGYDECYEWEVEDKRKAFVKDMEKGVCWNKFKEEQDETSTELEVEVLDELIHELLIDFTT